MSEERMGVLYLRLLAALDRLTRLYRSTRCELGTWYLGTRLLALHKWQSWRARQLPEPIRYMVGAAPSGWDHV